MTEIKYPFTIKLSKRLVSEFAACELGAYEDRESNGEKLAYEILDDSTPNIIVNKFGFGAFGTNVPQYGQMEFFA